MSPDWSSMRVIGELLAGKSSAILSRLLSVLRYLFQRQVGYPFTGICLEEFVVAGNLLGFSVEVQRGPAAKEWL
ncbi:hypothetical protein M7I_5543 [Glarea lozoyensis 74030]|uniref:Uncharacterized protein n=1 Tax=Glarea lozoyensis (strain ATCC 74030 / MF5533) TaxID=1104152 RepID=H0ES65_GLAL7|nr:hypothetical protein M7I_5543 [Glarea lozoyensis 74030]